MSLLSRCGNRRNKTSGAFCISPRPALSATCQAIRRQKAEDGTGDGHAACQTLNAKYNSRIKEARRACHKTLVNANIESGQDPDDLFSVMYGGRSLHVEMGQTMHDKRYEDNILQAFHIEYEKVRNASYEKQDFGLVGIRHMVHTMFVDSRSRPSHSMPVAGRGIAMQADGHTNSDVWCKYCRASTPPTRLHHLEGKGAAT